MVKLFYMDKEVQRIINSRDLYHVLLVSDDCTDQEILDSVYKIISKKVHPSLNNDKNASTAFKLVSHAYQVLKDDTKRERYRLNEEIEEDEIDPFELYLQFNPDPNSNKISISDIIGYIFFGLVVLQLFFDINPIHLFNRIFFNPLTRDEIRSVISFTPLPEHINFESDKGVPFYLPLSWIENVAQKTGFNYDESLTSMLSIADQIYEELLQEKCEMEKNLLNNSNGNECKKYSSFRRN